MPESKRHIGGVKFRALLSALLLLAQSLPLSPFASQALAACASPGSTGVGGTLSGVINTYFASPVNATTVAIGSTSLPLGTVSGAKANVSVGDELLIIQMQGATMNVTNTWAYGAGSTTGRGASAYTAGTYEYVVATSTGVSGGSVKIRGAGTGNGLQNAYTSNLPTNTTGKAVYQVIVVPQYSSATLGSGLSALPWNGRSGGVLALDVSGKLTLAGIADLSGRGFRGGGGRQLTGDSTLATTPNDYVNSSTLNAHGNKAEGVAGTPRYTYTSGDINIVDNRAANGSSNPLGYPGGDTAMGAPGNAGGGGTDDNPVANDDNSGGGGGGNGGIGGNGGNTYGGNLPTGGVGGDSLTVSASRLVLGGGGGSGTRNNSTPGSAESSGGSGGGMALIRAGSVDGTGGVNVNGGSGVTPANDGGGGGGAGGTALFYAGTTLAGTSLSLSADGGQGTDAWPTNTSDIFHGPGGGGAGGVLLTNVAATMSVTGGLNGTTTSSLNAYGATAGSGGIAGSVTNTSIPGLKPADTCTPASAPTITKQQANLTQGGMLSTAAITVKPGETLRYLLTVRNDTFKTQISLVFSDPLNASLNPPVSGTLTCPDGTTRTVTLGSTINVDMVASCGQNLKPGQSASLDFKTTVK